MDRNRRGGLRPQSVCRAVALCLLALPRAQGSCQKQCYLITDPSTCKDTEGCAYSVGKGCYAKCLDYNTGSCPTGCFDTGSACVNPCEQRSMAECSQGLLGLCEWKNNMCEVSCNQRSFDLCSVDGQCQDLGGFCSRAPCSALDRSQCKFSGVCTERAGCVGKTCNSRSEETCTSGGCMWMSGNGTCTTRCWGLDQDQCSEYGDCLWTLNQNGDRLCVPDCIQISLEEECEKFGFCAYSGTQCRPKQCIELDQGQCPNRPGCEWDAVNMACTSGPCSSQPEAACSFLDTRCVWSGCACVDRVIAPAPTHPLPEPAPVPLPLPIVAPAPLPAPIPISNPVFSPIPVPPEECEHTPCFGLSGKEACGTNPACAYNGTQGCIPFCSILTPTQCRLDPGCIAVGDSACTAPCALRGKEMCGDDDLCAWNHDDFRCAPQCKWRGKEVCEADGECVLGVDGNSECQDAPCTTISSHHKCLQNIARCTWDAGACHTKVCGLVSQESTCEANPACLWDSGHCRTSCGDNTSPSTCAAMGCNWEGGCTAACSGFDVFECESFVSCTFKGGSCRTLPCSSQKHEDCGKVIGCHEGAGKCEAKPCKEREGSSCTSADDSCWWDGCSCAPRPATGRVGE